VLRICVPVDQAADIFLRRSVSGRVGKTYVVQRCADVNLALEQLERLLVVIEAVFYNLLNVSYCDLYSSSP